MRTDLNTQLNRTSRIFGLMSDPTRLKIVSMLLNKDEMCVSDIAELSGLSLSAASHQLRKMELLGIVGKCRYGQSICYCLNKRNQLAKQMTELLKWAK